MSSKKANKNAPPDPLTELMKLCCGVTPRPPRNIAPSFVWRQSHSEEIAAEVNRRALAEGTSRKSLAPLREKVVKQMYAALPQEEKDKWSAKANEQHEDDLKKWKEGLKRPPSEELSVRQSYLKVLPDFLQLLVEHVGETTGWQASIIAGGPEPASGGRLNIVSAHSGSNQHGHNGPLREGQPEQPENFEELVELFGQFLSKCYTPDECRSQALPVSQQFTHIGGLDIDTNKMPATQIAGSSSARPTEPHDSPVDSPRSGSLTPRQSTPHATSFQNSQMSSRERSETALSSLSELSSVSSTAEADGYRVIQMRPANEYPYQDANDQAPPHQSEVSRGKRRADEAQLGENSNPSKRQLHEAI